MKVVCFGFLNLISTLLIDCPGFRLVPFTVEAKTKGEPSGKVPDELTREIPEGLMFLIPIDKGTRIGWLEVLVIVRVESKVLVILLKTIPDRLI